MVKKMMPMRTLSFQRTDRTAQGHANTVTYQARMVL
jgi:hypothetical protein